MTKFNFDKYKDKEFGCLRVLGYSHYDNQKKLNFIKVECKKCGNIKSIGSNRLNKEYIYCGLCKDKSRITINKRIRRIYANMKTRCYNPISNRYHCYGGRGIRVCDEWKNSFTKFQEWALQNGYADNLTLDRINNDGNYEPSNCRWVTYKQQRNNSSTNRIIELNGNKKTITEWCDYYNIPYYIVNNRINKYGWDIEKSFITPIKKERVYLFNGESLTIKQISQKTNIPRYTLYKHLKGQKDFSAEVWEKLDTFYQQWLKENGDGNN